MSDRSSASPVKSENESRRRGRSPERRSESPKRKRSVDNERPSRDLKEPGIRIRPDIKHVFVGPTGQRMGNNIKYYVSEKELEDTFSVYGDVDNVKVRSNTKDVFAFVHFKDSASAARAIEGMNGKELEGVKVKVDWGSNSSNRAPRRLPPSVRRRSPGRGGGDYRDSRSGGDRYRSDRRSPPPRRYEESYRRRSPSPRYYRERRRSPVRRSPPRYSRRSPSPRYARRSPSPRRRSPSPRYRRSPSPRRY